MIKYKNNFKIAERGDGQCRDCQHLIEIKEGLIYACDEIRDMAIKAMLCNAPDKWTCDCFSEKE